MGELRGRRMTVANARPPRGRYTGDRAKRWCGYEGSALMVAGVRVRRMVAGAVLVGGLVLVGAGPAAADPLPPNPGTDSWLQPAVQAPALTPQPAPAPFMVNHNRFSLASLDLDIF